MEEADEDTNNSSSVENDLDYTEPPSPLPECIREKVIDKNNMNGRTCNTYANLSTMVDAETEDYHLVNYTHEEKIYEDLCYVTFITDVSPEVIMKTFMLMFNCITFSVHFLTSLLMFYYSYYTKQKKKNAVEWF